MNKNILIPIALILSGIVLYAIGVKLEISFYKKEIIKEIQQSK